MLPFRVWTAAPRLARVPATDTVNRLWTKGVTQARPKIVVSGADVHLEQWKPARLWALVPDADLTDLEPHMEGDPPIVVRWKGRDYRIDGRRRIIQLKKRGDEGPHNVLVIQIHA